MESQPAPVSIDDAPTALAPATPSCRRWLPASGGIADAMHVDIDHFASVNENMSAEVGDQALVLVAQRLQSYPRAWQAGGMAATSS